MEYGDGYHWSNVWKKGGKYGAGCWWNKSKKKERPGGARVAKHLNNDTRYSCHVCGQNWDRWRENREKTTRTVRSVRKAESNEDVDMQTDMHVKRHLRRCVGFISGVKEESEAEPKNGPFELRTRSPSGGDL